MRLHELCKELSADSKRMLELAKELNLGVKSHSSNIPKGAENILRAAWREELEDMAKAAAKKSGAPPPEAASAPITARVADEGSGKPVASIEITSREEADARRKKRDDEEEILARARAEDEARIAAERAAAAGDDEDEEERGPAEAAEPEAEPVATAPDRVADDRKPMVVTVSGHAVGHEEPPVEAAPSAAAPAAAATEEKKRPERRGAKILGRIELKPRDLPQPRTARQAQPSQYDPLDPTRPMPARQPAPARGRGAVEEPSKAPAAKPARPAKGGSEFIFDPEDNTALSAIRLGHFGSTRRTPQRRPPMRRSGMPSRSKLRRKAERPTHGIEVRPPVAVRDLADLLGIKTREILERFPAVFDPRNKNAVLNGEQLLELSAALGREITVLEPETEEDRLLDAEEKRRETLAGTLVPRAPVVAVMGHVDHGKTTLLDTLRKTEVAKGEAGGITQRTSAYLVHSPSGAPVCFLDTPGHKAFTEMRARGASITDVALLVVAADDGVMDQTREAIDHINAAEVPLVVVINKVDKGSANPQMVRQQLAQAGVMVEDWGGEVGVVECSGLTGKGLDTLVERLALETEILELTADPGLPASGVVVDARKDPDTGLVITVVVEDGTLRARDAVLAGTVVGRVRYLRDDKGHRISEAGPGTPVEIYGLDEGPEAGVPFLVVEDINVARTVAAERKRRDTPLLTPAVESVTLENLFTTMASQKVTELNVIIKADSQGSTDVVRAEVERITHPEVRYKIIRAGMGAVSEEDVLLAQASHAVILAFGVVADVNAREALQRTGVELKSYDVIYEMIEELSRALEGELAPEVKENVTGHATVREVFKSSKYGSIAGSYVTDGTIARDSRIRLVRDGKIVWTGRLDSLRRFKDDVREVKENYECGLHLEGFNDIKAADVLEAFELVEVKRTLAQSAATT